MENASKALTMAGGVLIAIMIIGALLLMFNNMSSYQKSNAQNAKEAEVVKFNNQYTTYDRNKVLGNDLLTLINQVIDYNERKSTKGNEGSGVAFEPIVLTIKFEASGTKSRAELRAPGQTINELFTKNEYIQDTNKKIVDLEDIMRNVNNAKIAFGGRKQCRKDSSTL